MEYDQWQFRKVLVQDFQMVQIPKDAKDVTLITVEETYMIYDSNRGASIPEKQTVHYVIWLEKVGGS